MRKICLLVIDGGIILSGFLAGYWLRFSLPLFPEKGVPPLGPYLGIAWFSAAAWLLILSILGLYRQRLVSNFCTELACLLQGSFWAMVFVMAGTALYRGFSYSRLALGFSGLLSFCGLALFHFLLRSWCRNQEKKVAFVGQKNSFEKILKRFQLHHPSFSIRVYGESDLNNLRRNLCAFQPDFIIVSESTSEVNRFLQELSEELTIPLYFLPRFTHFLFSGQVENIDGSPLLLSGPLPL
ncbi:MAG TPA: hypothetical protein PKW42_12240, partial [bacterium]|nr:hypothetical protein [bacterium]